MTNPTSAPAPWRRVIGIVGGLGPHAHVRFEEVLLRAAEARVGSGASRDQDYPPYLVASLPGTPDRTDYVLGRGPSPLPWLERGLRTLKGASVGAGGGSDDGVRADFAVIACHAAHAVVPELAAMEILPILDIVEEAVARIDRRGIRKIGLLATTGTLQARLFQRACRARDLTAISPLDLPDGERLQRSLVMEVIYGGGGEAGIAGITGIKSGAHRRAGDRRRLLEKLERAASLLAQAGAEVVLTACTEIPLVLAPGTSHGIEILDPLEIAARAALEIASGERELPCAT